MKKQFLMVVVAVLAFAASVMAQQAPAFTVRANVPFQFVLAGKTMPAGDYTLSTSNANPAGAIELHKKGGSGAIATSIQTAETWSGDAQLHFVNVGGNYYLTEVRDRRTGVHQLLQGKSFTTLARKSGPAKSTIIAAK